MSSKFTDLTFILDRSGSMTPNRREVIGGFNTFIDDQRRIPGRCDVTLVQFDDRYQVDYLGLPLVEVPELTQRSYEPRGTTALLDATGRTIHDTGRRLAAIDPAERPDKVVVVVMTDGLENASHEYSRREVFRMIGHQREKYRWDVVFMGANQDAIAEGARIGIAPEAALTYDATAAGTRKAYAAMGAALGRARMSGGKVEFEEGERG